MVESIKYSVVKAIDRVEIRQYPRLVLVTVREMSDDDAFGILFSYISGQNKSQKKIAMTVPVVSTEKGEKVPMTTPVLSRKSAFSFVLPATFTAETAPIPIDNRARVEETPDRRMAVLRFRGSASSQQVKDKTDELLATLRSNNLTPKSEAILMRYNPPFIPGVFRRNEIAVEIAY